MRILLVLFGAIWFVSAVAASGALLIGTFLTPYTDVSNNRWHVFEVERGLSWDVFLADEQTRHEQQLTDHFASDRFPVLSPDNERMAFISWRDGNPEVYVLELISGELRNISNHPAIDMLAVWSQGGNMLAFVSERDGNAEIYLADIAHRMLYNLTQNPAHDTSPQWSADGVSIRFRSNRSGKLLDYQIAVGGQYTVQLEKF